MLSTEVCASAGLLGLPAGCLERIVENLDFLSVMMLSCVSTRMRKDSLPFWAKQQTPPLFAHELSHSQLGERFVAAACKAIETSALHTPDAKFKYASVVPDPLALRDAAAALDLSYMLRWLPPPKTVVSPSGSAGCESARSASHTGGRGGSKGSQKRGPPPKITPLTIAILTRSSRAVEALLDEAGGTCDPMLAPNNPGGQMPRLDLAVHRLPSAHLGQYTVTRRRDGEVKSVLSCKDVTVRVVDDPEATQSSVYACPVLTRSCVNTMWLLEMAFLIHEPRICELLLLRTEMKAPRYSIVELLGPNSVCGASFARLGAEHIAVSPVSDTGCSESDGTTSADDDVVNERPEITVSFCMDLDSCTYARDMLRIARAFIGSSRLSASLSIESLSNIADFGDAEIISRLQIPGSARTAISQRQRWRILYESVKRRQLESSSNGNRSRIDGETGSRRVAAWHVCLSRRHEAEICRNLQLLPASRIDVEAKLIPFCNRVTIRRRNLLKELSPSLP